MDALLVVGSVFAALAALLHVYIFVLESVLWMRPSTWRTFGIRSRDEAETTRPLAFNQGFYNLFLALTVAVGLLLSGTSAEASVALVLAGTGSMLLAALVLVLSSPKLARSAAIQGALPLVAVVLIAFSLLIGSPR